MKFIKQTLTLLCIAALLIPLSTIAGDITFNTYDSQGNPIPGEIRISLGPNYVGTYPSGSTVTLNDGSNYKIWATYNATSTSRMMYTPSGNDVINFSTTNVTIHFSGGYCNYRGSGSWKSFARPSMELFPKDFYGNTMKFQFGDKWNNKRYTYKTIDYEGQTSIEKTIAVLQLLGHDGTPISGAKARGGNGAAYGSWHVPGSTDANGLIMDCRDGNPAALSYEMRYNKGTQVVGPQNPSTNSYYNFQTELVTLRLETCDGTPLDGAHPRFGSGAAYYQAHWPNGNTGQTAPGETTAELFQGTYSFEMNQHGTYERKISQNVPDGGATFVWTTTNVTLNYSGNISFGGASGDSRWFTKPSMELLSGTYKFHFRGGFRSDISISGCDIEKTAVFAQLKDSDNNGLAGGSFKYRFGYGSYTSIGTDPTGDGIGFFLSGSPGNTKVKVSYKGASVEKQQNVQTNSIFIFNTVKVTADLQESDSDDITGDATWKYRIGYGPYSIFDPAGEELLPTNVKVNVAYKGASKEKQQNVGTNAHFDFNTVKVTADLQESDSDDITGDATWKYRIGYGPYSTFDPAGEELLPTNVKVNVAYKGASKEKQQNVGTNAHFDFNTVKVTADLQESDSDDITGDATWLYRIGYGPYSTFDPAGEELLATNVKVKASHKGASKEKQQNVGTNAHFDFNTVKVTATLMDGATDVTGSATWQYRIGYSSYSAFDPTGDEFLPVNLKVKVSYMSTSDEKQQNVGTSPHFSFAYDGSTIKRATAGAGTAKSPVSLYPNPASSIVTIEAEGIITIYNLNGKLMYAGSSKTIDISNWAKGLYMITADGETLKLMVE